MTVSGSSLSVGSWAIGFVLGWESTLGFIDWTFYQVWMDMSSLRSLRKCHGNCPGQWLREWNRESQESLKQEGLSRGRRQDCLSSTPSVWTVSLIFDCWWVGIDLGLRRCFWSTPRNIVTWSETQHMNIPAPGMGSCHTRSPNKYILGWVHRGICAILGSEARL